MTFVAPFQSTFGGQRAAFAPTDIAGLAMWLKSDVGVFQSSGGSAAILDGDVVGEWQDQSGNGRHVTQATTANKPTLRLSQLNGLPALQLDGGDFLTRASVSLSSLVATNAATIFAVLYQTDSDAQNALLGIYAPSLANSFNILATYENVVYFDLGDANSGGRISVAQPSGWDNAYHTLELYRSGTSGVIRSDGVDLLSSSGFTDTLDVTQVGTLYIGGAAVAVVLHTGYFVELIIYNRALTTDERTSVRGYLSTRTGLSA